MTQEKFEIYAIIELFGHNKMAGKVTEQVIGGASFIRVDVPETKSQPSFTRMLHANAIYAINPVTEEVATGYAERIQVQPIQSWDAREVLKRIDEMKKLGQANTDEDRMREAEDDLREPHEDDDDERPY